ncbi:hypothetical protein JHK87_018466 [Glycine soja]|nr:hypothetical protein JHK87_018466 [Glycine soja]
MRAYSIILFMSCPFSYARLYKDVQNEVDLCHRDGTLKQKSSRYFSLLVARVGLCIAGSIVPGAGEMGLILLSCSKFHFGS